MVLTLLALEWLMSVVLRAFTRWQAGSEKGACRGCEDSRTLPTAFLTLTPQPVRARVPSGDAADPTGGPLNGSLNTSTAAGSAGSAGSAGVDDGSGKRMWSEYFSQRLMAIPIGLCLAAEITLSNLSLLTLRYEPGPSPATTATTTAAAAAAAAANSTATPSTLRPTPFVTLRSDTLRRDRAQPLAPGRRTPHSALKPHPQHPTPPYTPDTPLTHPRHTPDTTH